MNGIINDINDLLSDLYPASDISSKMFNSLAARECNSIFSVSSKYKAIYHEPSNELSISAVADNSKKASFLFDNLRCFIFSDNDTIVGFDGTCFFIIDIENEELQKVDTDFISVSKISLFPEESIKENQSQIFFVLDDSTSHLHTMEIMEGMTCYTSDVFQNVIDFTISPSKVIVLYQNKAVSYQYVNSEFIADLEIAFDHKMPNYITCTRIHYLIYTTTKVYVYNEAGDKIDKLENGKYICSSNHCAVVQLPESVTLYTDVGSYTILSIQPISASFSNNILYYMENDFNLCEEKVIIKSNHEPSYFAITDKVERIQKKNLMKICKDASKACNFASIVSKGTLKEALISFDERVELSTFQNKILAQYNFLTPESIKQLESDKHKWSTFYLFKGDDKTSVSEIRSLIKMLSSDVTAILQGEMVLVHSESRALIERVSTFLHEIMPEAKLLETIEGLPFLRLMIPYKCQIPKSKLIEKKFECSSIIYTEVKDHLVLKFDSKQTLQSALASRIMKIEKKEYQIVPFVEYDKYINMRRWKILLRGLPPNTTKMDIYNEFMKYGMIYMVESDANNETTLQFIDEKAANEAIRANNATIKETKIILINYSKASMQKNPSRGSQVGRKFEKVKKNATPTPQRHAPFHISADSLITHNTNNNNNNSNNSNNNNNNNKANGKSNNKNKENFERNEKNKNNENNKNNRDDKNNKDDKNDKKNENNNSKKNEIEKNNMKKDNGSHQNNNGVIAPSDNATEGKSNGNAFQATTDSMQEKALKKKLKRQRQREAKRKLQEEQANKLQPNQIQSDQIKPNQIHPNQIQSDQIKTNQIKPNQILQNQNQINPNQILNQADQQQQQPSPKKQQQEKSSKGSDKSINHDNSNNNSNNNNNNNNSSNNNKKNKKKKGQQSDSDRFNFTQPPNLLSSKNIISSPDVKVSKRSSASKPPLQLCLTVFVINHISAPSEVLVNKFSTARSVEAFDPLDHDDDRPVLKLVFNDATKHKNFVDNFNGFSEGLRLVRLVCGNIESVPECIKKYRKKIEGTLIRLSGIPKDTSKGTLLKACRTALGSTSALQNLEYFEVIHQSHHINDNNNDDEFGDTLMCDLAVTAKKDVNAMTRAIDKLDNLEINDVNIKAEPYMQWIQDHRK